MRAKFLSIMSGGLLFFFLSSTPALGQSEPGQQRRVGVNIEGSEGAQIPPEVLEQLQVQGPGKRIPAPACGECPPAHIICDRGVLYVDGPEECSNKIDIFCDARDDKYRKGGKGGKKGGKKPLSVFCSEGWLEIYMGEICPGATQVYVYGSDQGDDQIFAELTCEGARAQLFGGEGNDVLYGGGGDDIIYGGRGNDRIDGGGGNDELHGENGNDRIDGGKGADLIDGGNGRDHLHSGFNLSPDPECNQSYRRIQFYDDAGLNPERLFGGDGDDCIHAKGSTSYIEGGPGDDHIKGTGMIYGDSASSGESGGRTDGRDVINVLGMEVCARPLLWVAESWVYGQGGDDKIMGFDGDNARGEIRAGDGDDHVLDPRGANTSYGGEGGDTLVVPSPGYPLGDGFESVFYTVDRSVPRDQWCNLFENDPQRRQLFCNAFFYEADECESVFRR